MRILVTGGAGYIGSVVTEFLLEGAHAVVVVDNLSTGHRGAIDERVTFHQGDLLDEGFLAPILGGIDAVCHFAAFSQVAESMADPITYYRNNVGGAVSLLSAMKRAGVRYFLFSSSAAVYGEPDETPIRETAPLCPVNAYGNTKLAIERLLADCSAAWDLRALSLRYFNAAGAGIRHGEDHRPETHLIPLVLDVALGRRDELVVYGKNYATRDGTCVRDYIHVKDLATAHLLGLEKLIGGYSGVLNLGNGRGFTVLEVIRAAEKVTGLEVSYRFGERRAGDPAVLVASSEEAESVLGWKRFYPRIEDIIRDAYAWKQSHLEGYEF
jgi:UDP-glucose 4-epimerase